VVSAHECYSGETLDYVDNSEWFKFQHSKLTLSRRHHH